MIQLNLQTQENLDWRITRRSGETKLGEQVSIIKSLDALPQNKDRYVVFGICEDIGVQANFGKPGAAKAWDAFLDAFVNVQSTESIVGDGITILGYISVTPDEKLTHITPKESLGAIVSRIDKKVADLVYRIISIGKYPIIIGGGHNNAFGNLKGSSLALRTPLNVINLDAHTDLRTADYRHSGNGFSYALENREGSYIKKYVIFGLHKNYTPQYILNYIQDKKDQIAYYLLDNMLTVTRQQKAFSKALNTVSSTNFGIEIDCDSIAYFPSSAQTPSGFTIEMMREFILTLGTQKNSVYLHICEAAPTKKDRSMVGKSLTYFVTDFIRSHCDNNSV